MLDGAALQQELHEVLLFQLHHLHQDCIAILVEMIDICSLPDESFGELEVDVLIHQHVHQDSLAVLVFFIDVGGVVQYELVQTLIVIVLGGEHHWS